MRPSEVRDHILSDHAALREMLEEIASLSREILAGQRGLAAPLRERGRRLLERLLEHMRWEDLYLAPALREADAWGEERAAELDREHREQREILHEALQRLADDSLSPKAVAQDLRELVARLHTDMEQEERDVLDERVLRDDVVGIDVESG